MIMKKSLSIKKLLFVALLSFSGWSFNALGGTSSQSQPSAVSQNQNSSSSQRLKNQTASALQEAIDEQQKLIESQQKLISDLIKNYASKQRISKEQRYLKKMQRDLVKMQKLQSKYIKKGAVATTAKQQQSSGQPSKTQPDTQSVVDDKKVNK